MPEIKFKHVVSFSSEDKVHKAENLLKSETYRKWKCANPGEKNASVILQFEKATKINSIDIGNESSAFVEVLVGRSSDSVTNYQVLLVASSFMSPIESRNETHNNRVRMFGPDKLAQNLKEEKWDCVQVVCTQPFNKNITYGLSFIKFHSPQEKNAEQVVESETKGTTTKLGAFNIKYDDEEDDDSLPSIGSWLDRKKAAVNSSLVKADSNKSTTYASSVLSSSSSPKTSQHSIKRKHDDVDSEEKKTSAKKESPSVKVNKEKVGHKDIFGGDKLNSTPTRKEKEKYGPKDLFGLNSSASNTAGNSSKNKLQTLNQEQNKSKTGKVNFNQLMKGVVFVISGFVNPLRSEIRDKALEMGAKYKGDWDRTCTHLICAFVNTPKYIQVRGENGKIVTKDWIIDCHKKRLLLPWRKYMLGRYSRDSSNSSDSEEESPKLQYNKKNLTNGTTKTKITENKNKKVNSNPSFTNRIAIKPKSDSETEDEEAIKDYIADTDVTGDSGDDTEEEIRKCENASKLSNFQNKQEKNNSDDELVVSDDDSSLLQTKPNTTNIPIAELPNLFKSKHFFLYGNFSESTQNALKRLIIAYNGIIKDYMGDTVKYVISESAWDKNFEEALSENEDLIFVKPEWIWKCHEKEKLVPYQPYIIIPDS